MKCISNVLQNNFNNKSCAANCISQKNYNSVPFQISNDIFIKSSNLNALAFCAQQSENFDTYDCNAKKLLKEAEKQRRLYYQCKGCLHSFASRYYKTQSYDAPIKQKKTLPKSSSAVSDKMNHYFTLAVKEYDKAIHENPKCVQAYIGKGDAYLEKFYANMYEYHKTKYNYEQNKNAGPEHSFFAAAIYIQKEYLKDSMRCYASALKLEPNNAEASYKLGLALFENYSINKSNIRACNMASSYLSKYLQSHPTDSRAMTMLASVKLSLYIRGKADKSVIEEIEKHCSSAIGLERNNQDSYVTAEAHRIRGYLYYKLATKNKGYSAYTKPAISDFAYLKRRHLEDNDIKQKLRILCAKSKKSETPLFDFFDAQTLLPQ